MTARLRPNIKSSRVRGIPLNRKTTLCLAAVATSGTGHGEVAGSDEDLAQVLLRCQLLPLLAGDPWGRRVGHRAVLRHQDQPVGRCVVDAVVGPEDRAARMARFTVLD